MSLSPQRRRPAVRLLVAAVMFVLVGPMSAAQAAPGPGGPGGHGGPGGIEDYPSYQPATRCSPAAKPGAVQLGRWLTRRFDGGSTSISRACGGSTSEHTEGRAVDWSADARTRAGQARAHAFLDRIRAADARGNTDALARRMGIMYVIWDDEIYSAWNGYDPEPYLNSGCTKLKTCSPTLRHRDHVHVSLTRKAGRAQTSWYAAR